jgi:hypothetical protein
MSSDSNSESREAPIQRESLAALLRREITSIPIAQWGYFFPCHVAVWRFIEAHRPGVLGVLSAGYTKEPYFRGKGADWFCGVLGNQGDYLSLLERVMYRLVDDLPAEAKTRGFLLEHEIPALDLDTIGELSRVVLAHLDTAIEKGTIV